MKVYIGFALIDGSSVVAEMPESKMFKFNTMTEEERLKDLGQFLQEARGDFIIHGSRVINVDHILYGFLEERERKFH